MDIRRVVLAFCIMAFGAGTVFGQDPSTELRTGYPNKPIRILTNTGGSSELKTRLIAQGITGPLGQPVIVEPKAAPLIGTVIVSKAPPDGYTLLFNGQGLWLMPLLQKAPYDALRDFSPISLVDKSPTGMAVHPSLPVKSVKELISLAKARPGDLNYASAGPGSSGWFAMELFKSMASVNIVSVPYKNLTQSLTALMSGEVQVLFADPTLVTPHVKAGRLRALAVTSATPSALAPGWPTIAASGLPGYEYTSVTSIVAPAKTPETIIRRLNQEVVRVLSNQDMKRKFLDLGVETVSSSPEELTAMMKSDVGKIGKLIKDAGIHVE